MAGGSAGASGSGGPPSPSITATGTVGARGVAASRQAPLAICSGVMRSTRTATTPPSVPSFSAAV